MAVAVTGQRLKVYDTASAVFEGTTISTNGEASKGLPCGEYNSIGFWTMISATNGTNETLDITFEWSEDSTNGVDGNWASMPENNQGSTTASAMTQITTSSGAFAKYFQNPCSTDGWIRSKFAITGTATPGYDIETMYWVCKDPA